MQKGITIVFDRKGISAHNVLEEKRILSKKLLFSILVATTLFVSMTATSLAATSTIGNLVKNGDFETPVVPNGGFIEYAAGQTFGNWHVASGSIDLINTQYFDAGHGNQSVDMDGSTWGTIYQDLQTQGGTTYALSLLLAKNPVCSGTTLMKLWVAWETTAGKVIGKQLLTFNRNSSVENMRWEQVQIGINATGSVTRLVFQSGTPGPCGPAIDDVIVV